LEKAIAAGIEKVVTIDNVIRDLADREPMVRILAIENLVISCEYDNDISKAIPQLVKALKDQDLGVRRNAAFAFLILSEHKYDLSGSRKALLEAVKDKDEKVKEYARKSTENLKSR
jgi:HEAT repeat protein